MVKSFVKFVLIKTLDPFSSSARPLLSIKEEMCLERSGTDVCCSKLIIQDKILLIWIKTSYSLQMPLRLWLTSRMNAYLTCTMLH